MNRFGLGGRESWGKGGTSEVCAKHGLLSEHVHRAVVSHARRQVRVTRRHARQSQKTVADGQTGHTIRLIQGYEICKYASDMNESFTRPRGCAACRVRVPVRRRRLHRRRLGRHRC